MPNIPGIDLGPAQVRDFIDEGFVRLDGTFSPDLAATCRAALRAEAGFKEDDPGTWPGPVLRLGFRGDACFRDAPNTPRLHAAYDRLAGAGRWHAPTGLGTFPIRFPSPEPPPDTGWHVDMSFGTEAPDVLDWRVNVTSRGRALLMLFLLSDTGTNDGPTLLRAGSHRIIARDLIGRGPEGATLRELASDGWTSSAGCEERLATGPAGTVWLCNPFLVQAAQANRGMRPSYMAQPPLLPSGDFDPSLPPSPVQIAMREACGLSLWKTKGSPAGALPIPYCTRVQVWLAQISPPSTQPARSSELPFRVMLPT